jgi:Tfp pilus assembly protein PilO
VSARLRSLSPTVVSVLVGFGALLVLAAGVFLLVLPQRSKAAHLSDELATAQAKVVTARALATQRPEQRIRVADLFKIVEAMPDDDDMTGVILQLQQTAGEAGVTFDSIQPQAAQPGTGYQVLPIDLLFDGNYFSLTDFLFRLRKLVSVHHGKLDAKGRLFTVDRVDFQPGANGFPQISAAVRVSAYVYDSASMGVGVVPVPAGAAPAGTTSTPAPAPAPAPASPSGAVASGVTP